MKGKDKRTQMPQNNDVSHDGRCEHTLTNGVTLTNVCHVLPTGMVTNMIGMNKYWQMVSHKNVTDMARFPSHQMSKLVPDIARAGGYKQVLYSAHAGQEQITHIKPIACKGGKPQAYMWSKSGQKERCINNQTAGRHIHSYMKETFKIKIQKWSNSCRKG